MVEQSKRYTELGQRVLSEKFPRLLNVRVAWLISDKRKTNNGKLVLGECAKVSENDEWCCPYDFKITIYEPNVLKLSEEQILILLEHEIMHIGVDGDRKYIVPHDTDEFTEIIRKYGIDWAKGAE